MNMMFRVSIMRLQVAGTYIAWHPWLDSPFGHKKLFKVGFSENLPRRLTNSSYLTCFSDEWRYVATFETKSGDDARLIERSLLHVCSKRCLPGKELVHLSEKELVEKAKDVVNALGLKKSVTYRSYPVYTLAPSSSSTPSSSSSHHHHHHHPHQTVTPKSDTAAPASHYHPAVHPHHQHYSSASSMSSSSGAGGHHVRQNHPSPTAAHSSTGIRDNSPKSSSAPPPPPPLSGGEPSHYHPKKADATTTTGTSGPSMMPQSPPTTAMNIHIHHHPNLVTPLKEVMSDGFLSTARQNVFNASLSTLDSLSIKNSGDLGVWSYTGTNVRGTVATTAGVGGSSSSSVASPVVGGNKGRTTAGNMYTFYSSPTNLVSSSTKVGDSNGSSTSSPAPSGDGGVVVVDEEGFTPNEILERNMEQINKDSERQQAGEDEAGDDEEEKLALSVYHSQPMIDSQRCAAGGGGKNKKKNKKKQSDEATKPTSVWGSLTALSTNNNNDRTLGNLAEEDEEEIAAIQEHIFLQNAQQQQKLKGGGGGQVILHSFQQDAVRCVLEELQKETKAILHMACRCGKTPVAYNVLHHYLQRPSSTSTLVPGTKANQAEGDESMILFLVPSLGLLRQTVHKLVSYGLDAPIMVVGSDKHPIRVAAAPPTTSGKKKNGPPSNPPMGTHEYKMTTDPKLIKAFCTPLHSSLQRHKGKHLQQHHRHDVLRRGKVVLCTYQSSELLSSLDFSLIVFDECHRACGSSDPSPFNHILLLERFQQQQHKKEVGDGIGSRKVPHKLFMTATPVMSSLVPINMKHRHDLFGRVAYRFTLRQGIDFGLVNSFKVRLIVGPTTPLIPPKNDTNTAEGSSEDDGGGGRNYTTHIVDSMRLVDKMLVFVRTIEDGIELYKFLKMTSLPRDVQPFEVLVAHCGLPSGGVARALRNFGESKRVVLINCRLFQEGVELPDLNAVFFACPKGSHREIIQSLCRPLNKMKRKPPSYVFLPVDYRKDQPSVEKEALTTFARVGPFFNALLDEDPSMYDTLANPASKPDQLRAMATRQLGMTNDQLEMFIVPTILKVLYKMRSMKARLTSPGYIPWVKGYPELKRVVETLNRYPRASDYWVVGDSRVSIMAFYRWCQSQYALNEEDSELEPHQRHDLEKLPLWTTFGLRGAYDMGDCTKLLIDYLVAHDEELPMVDVRCAYNGLDATVLERIAGFFFVLNLRRQRLSKREKQAIETLCARFPDRLRWSEDGKDTFITEAAASFKKHLDEQGATSKYIQENFPGYPQKHRKFESLDVLEQGLAPPKISKKKSLSLGGDSGSLIRPEVDIYSREPAADGTLVFRCKLCKTIVIGEEQWFTHERTKNHKMAVEELLAEMKAKRAELEAAATALLAADSAVAEAATVANTSSSSAAARGGVAAGSSVAQWATGLPEQSKTTTPATTTQTTTASPGPSSSMTTSPKSTSTGGSAGAAVAARKPAAGEGLMVSDTMMILSNDLVRCLVCDIEMPLVNWKLHEEGKHHQMTMKRRSLTAELSQQASHPYMTMTSTTGGGEGGSSSSTASGTAAIEDSTSSTREKKSVNTSSKNNTNNNVLASSLSTEDLATPAKNDEELTAGEHRATAATGTATTNTSSSPAGPDTAQLASSSTSTPFVEFEIIDSMNVMCKVCDTRMVLDSWRSHKAGRAHNENLTRMMRKATGGGGWQQGGGGGLGWIKEEDVPDSDLLEMTYAQDINGVETVVCYCKVCDTSMTGIVPWQSHIKGKQHMKRRQEAIDGDITAIGAIPSSTTSPVSFPDPQYLVIADSAGNILSRPTDDEYYDSAPAARSGGSKEGEGDVGGEVEEETDEKRSRGRGREIRAAVLGGRYPASVVAAKFKLICTICDMSMSGGVPWEMHVKGKQHRRNSSIITGKPATSSSDHFICEACGGIKIHKSIWEQHVTSPRHLQLVKEVHQQQQKKRDRTTTGSLNHGGSLPPPPAAHDDDLKRMLKADDEEERMMTMVEEDETPITSAPPEEDLLNHDHDDMMKHSAGIHEEGELSGGGGAEEEEQEEDDAQTSVHTTTDRIFSSWDEIDGDNDVEEEVDMDAGFTADSHPPAPSQPSAAAGVISSSSTPSQPLHRGGGEDHGGSSVAEDPDSFDV